MSSNASESLHTEKHDMLSSQEVDSVKSTVSGDIGGHFSSHSPHLLKGDSSELQRQASGEWVHGWNSDYSLDNELVIANEENARLRCSLEVADCSISQIKSDMSLLQNYANELCSDTQKFANQLASEFASGQELRKEVFMLKSECLQLKHDIEQLKAIKFSPLSDKEMTDRGQHFENLKLQWMEGLLLIENKVREIQNNTSNGFQDGNFSFLGPDLELLLSALRGLRQINEPECGFHSSPAADSLDITSALREKIFVLLRDLNESKAEGESLARKMDQMECYYETLIHELEENQKLMVAELHNVRTEHSTCFHTLSVTKTEMETMHQDFSEHIARYAEDRRELDKLNKDLEKRLVSSEAALKRARLNYSIAVDQLQKDLELLSLQIISMHQTNENLIKQAFPKPPELCISDDPTIQQDLRCSGAVQHLNRQIPKQLIGRDMVSEDLKASLQLQEQLFQKVEAEICEMQQRNLELDVFATSLQEAWLEANCQLLFMNDAEAKLTHQFKSAINSKESLKRRLQIAEEDLEFLNDFKNSCVLNCEKLDLQNQTLEANLEALTVENHLLSQNIQASESLVLELGVYKGKYETCNAERNNIEDIHRQKCIANEGLANKVCSMEEMLRHYETKCLELASQNDYMSDTIGFLEDKLRCMLRCYSQTFHNQVLSLPVEYSDEKLDDMDFRKVLVQLELTQNEACGKLLKLKDENEKLNKERESVHASLIMKSSEISTLKTKLKSILLDMHHFLEKSDAAVQKLQSELDAFVQRVQLTSESEVTEALPDDEFVQSLSHLEVQMHAIASRHNNFVHEILALENVAEEHGRSERILSELNQENHALRTKLQESTSQSAELETKIDILKENVTSLQNKLQVEICRNGKLESQISELTQKLNETSNQLTCLKQKLQEIESMAERLVSNVKVEDTLSQLEDVVVNGFTVLEAQLKNVTLDCQNLAAEISALQTTNEELGSSKFTIQELTQENEVLGSSLKERVAVSTQLEAEMVKLKDTLEGLRHELDRERDVKTNLESEVADLAQENKISIMALQERDDKCLMLKSEISSLTKRLEALAKEFNCMRDLKENFERRAEELTCQLSKSNEQLLDFEKQKDTLAEFSQQVLNLEAENSSLTCHLQNHEERLLSVEKLSSLTGLEIDELLGLLLVEDVKLSFLQTRYEGVCLNLFEQIKSSDSQNKALHIKCVQLDTKLDECMAREKIHVEDNAKLTNDLESLKHDLEASVSQNKILLESQSSMLEEIGRYRYNMESLEVCSVSDKNHHAVNMKEPSSSLESSDNQTDGLLFLNEMLSIEFLVLNAKFNEMLPHFTLLGNYKQEVTKLKLHCTDLTQRLSEEIMKAEEFKSLSVHFKELKDRAEAQCAQASEKNDKEGHTMVRQDSLRIAFIKEQCETEIQELKHQLSVSKKHSDEMLWKLQDAINETECRKKSEASYMKKIDELSAVISQLETELERAVSEKREKVMDNDRMQAELDCSLISLECCKEEKQKIEALLVQCQAELAKSDRELVSVKEKLNHFTDRCNLLMEAGDYPREATESDGLSKSQRGMNADNFMGESIIRNKQPKSLIQSEFQKLPDEEMDSDGILHKQVQVHSDLLNSFVHFRINPNSLMKCEPS